MMATITAPVPGGSYSDTWHAPRAGGRRHMGTDIFADEGTAVVAAHNGVIDRGRYGNSGGLGGIRLWVEGAGIDTYYAHLASVTVPPGAIVTAGQQIGRVGRTGNAATTPPHLHFEVHLDGQAVNPAPLLDGADVPPPQGGALGGLAGGPLPSPVQALGLGWITDPAGRRAAAAIAGGIALIGAGVVYYWSDDLADVAELAAAVYTRGASTAVTGGT